MGFEIFWMVICNCEFAWQELSCPRIDIFPENFRLWTVILRPLPRENRAVQRLAFAAINLCYSAT